jgi:superfamily II DNA or RNA helicase
MIYLNLQMSPDKFLRNLKTRQRSPRENISQTFLEPGLRICNHYRRNTAWFRQSAIGVYAPALRHFIDNNAKMDMLVSLTGKVNKDVIKALERTKDEESKKNILLNFGNEAAAKLLGLQMRPDDWEFQHHVLIYLLAKKKLEIRFAITKPYEGAEDEDFFHEKAGYMTFPDGNSLSFIGNFNESRDSIGVHGERLHIFPSTDPNYDEDREYYINDIDLQWNGKDEFTEVHKLSEETLKKVKEYALSEEEMKEKKRKFEKKINEEQKIYSSEEIKTESNVPIIPKLYKGNKFKINNHQEKALTEWSKSGFKGILAHATGSGKTVTAVLGLCKLAEQAKTVAIIGVPYQSLADQWVDELTNFNVNAIKCYESKNNWYLQTQQAIAKHNIRDSKKSYLLALVVVNKTLKSSRFQEVISEIPPEELIFIGDECHRYCSINGTQNLPNANFRLGLSATPFGNEEFSSAENNELRSYFGDICDEFTIRDALDLNILCQYKYLPISVHLTDEEYDDYKEHAGKLYLGSDDSNKQEINMSAVSGMARALGSAENKFKAFDKLIKTNGLSGRTIVFCGDGSTELDNDSNELNENEQKDKEIAYQILRETNIRTSFFTCNENSKRRREILDDFSNSDIKCLISIRVLDEGIDVPEVENAFLLASSRNRRQFVQRRGRILRKSINKEYAYLYDFVCLPPPGEKSSSIVEKELERVIEMTLDCDNIDENIGFIKTLISSYDINEDIQNKISALINEQEKNR